MVIRYLSEREGNRAYVLHAPAGLDVPQQLGPARDLHGGRAGVLKNVGEWNRARHLRGARARVGVPDVPGLLLDILRTEQNTSSFQVLVSKRHSEHSEKIKIKNKTNLGHRGFAVRSAHSVAVFSFYHRLLAVPQLGQRGCLVERGFKAVGKFIADQVRVRVAVVVSADARLVGSVDDIRGIAAGVWVNKARRHYNCPYSRYGNRDELTPRL